MTERCRFCNACPPSDPQYYGVEGERTKRPACRECLEKRISSGRYFVKPQRYPSTAQGEYEGGYVE